MKKKILIVDDENDVFVFLNRILTKRFNCESYWAENGLEGIKHLEKNQIDGIILDVDMPVMDGLDTLKVIKKMPKLNTIPILMCTSMSDKEKVKDILSLGIKDYLLKPVNSSEAVERIEGFLKSLESNKIIKNDKVKIISCFDDDSVNLLLVERFKGKYEHITTKNGIVALSKVDKEIPDEVIVGDNIGSMNAVDVAKNIRNISKADKRNDTQSKGKNIRILYCGNEFKDEGAEIFDFITDSIEAVIEYLGDSYKV